MPSSLCDRVLPFNAARKCEDARLATGSKYEANGVRWGEKGADRAPQAYAASVTFWQSFPFPSTQCCAASTSLGHFTVARCSGEGDATDVTVVSGHAKRDWRILPGKQGLRNVELFTLRREYLRSCLTRI